MPLSWTGVKHPNVRKQARSSVLTDPEFKTAFPDGIVTRKALSVVPDGFTGSDPAAPFLKMIGLGCRKDMPDALLLDDELVDPLIEIFRTASSLVRYFD